MASTRIEWDSFGPRPQVTTPGDRSDDVPGDGTGQQLPGPGGGVGPPEAVECGLTTCKAAWTKFSGDSYRIGHEPFKGPVCRSPCRQSVARPWFSHYNARMVT